jgi:hypothetical protein
MIADGLKEADIMFMVGIKEAAKREYLKYKQMIEECEGFGIKDTNNEKMFIAIATLNAGICNNNFEMFKKGIKYFKKYSSLMLKDFKEDIEDDEVELHFRAVSRMNDVKLLCDNNKKQVFSSMVRDINKKNNVYEQIGKMVWGYNESQV